MYLCGVIEQPHYQFLSNGDYRLPYLEFGTGPELLLAFHGFGRSSHDFLPFTGLIGKKYTLIAFDFFYHGPHAVPADQELPPISGAQLAKMIELLLWQKKKVRCSMIGYSQGGRIVLGQIHHLPHRIHELFIVAPDGLRKNKTRDFVGRTWAGRLIGLSMIRFPGLIRWTLRLLRATGKLNARQSNFYLHQTREKNDRWKIYHTWLLLAQYNIHRDLIKHYLIKKPIRMEFIMGKYDAIIPVKWAQHFIQGFRGNVRLHILESGHDVLQMKEEVSAILLEEEK